MRLATIFAVGAIVGSAQADLFYVVTEGTFEVGDRVDDTIVGMLDAIVSEQDGPFGFGSVTGEFSAELTDPGPFTGVFDLVSEGGDGVVSIELAGIVLGDNVAFSYSAEWTLSGATGIYAGLTGSGNLAGSHVFANNDGGDMRLKILGDLVPVPSTLALLGVGGAFLARRRR